jgi:hypothetical protein
MSERRCRVQVRNAGGGKGRLLLVASRLVFHACASGPKPSQSDRAALAAVPAELRMLGVESTWDLPLR